MDAAFGRPLSPTFDPCAPHFTISSYPIVHLVAGLLAVESGQEAVIRGRLYEHALTRLHPYGIAVTNRISDPRDKLGHEGIKDEYLVVPKKLGAEDQIGGNVLAGDEYSVEYTRTPEEILRVVSCCGNESITGDFYPKGADGRIAKSHLQHC
ncbi:hypothetical protein NC653_025549 [Populus alba x Populus x berolinensis]|uniref:Uncharacterized protein n=1 Tax=Populus alba x Populus x berolinensis TaxID=444605 RepID=A0AAD6MDW0_9ROSI|nr:hypothetical protein NC653_025549 [Populus alba x Populus x berolinensis]